MASCSPLNMLFDTDNIDSIVNVEGPAAADNIVNVEGSAASDNIVQRCTFLAET